MAQSRPLLVESGPSLEATGFLGTLVQGVVAPGFQTFVVFFGFPSLSRMLGLRCFGTSVLLASLQVCRGLRSEEL